MSDRHSELISFGGWTLQEMSTNDADETRMLLRSKFDTIQVIQDAAKKYFSDTNIKGEQSAVIFAPEQRIPPSQTASQVVRATITCAAEALKSGPLSGFFGSPSSPIIHIIAAHDFPDARNLGSIPGFESMAERTAEMQEEEARGIGFIILKSISAHTIHTHHGYLDPVTRIRTDYTTAGRPSQVQAITLPASNPYL